MAFAQASGYTNLNNGNFSPVIYSKKSKRLLEKFCCEDITNTDYFGEISQHGTRQNYKRTRYHDHNI